MTTSNDKPTSNSSETEQTAIPTNGPSTEFTNSANSAAASNAQSDGSKDSEHPGRAILTRMCEDAAVALEKGRAYQLRLLAELDAINSVDVNRAQVSLVRAKAAIANSLISSAHKTIDIGHDVGVFKAPKSGGKRQEA